MDIEMGDVVQMKKAHPCGSREWQVVRLGADIGIRCLKCQRRLLLERPVFQRRLKALISRGQVAHSSGSGASMVDMRGGDRIE